jgi:hypothetical protein
MKTKEKIETICGKVIYRDASGVGHAWRPVAVSDLPANIADEIAAEIIDGRNDSSRDFAASNGLHYRW